ncbi:probable glycosyltransferase At5g20260 [Hibiscus syriacus]|uniref:probable glycosyltransferase At5g20260 n=1 Tax=Hibiscus syriacus TaxID=106335 RepID=UPI001923E073|nr:probable glycosyltransferase At5g20260 [Hibiscus syriacus]
MVGTSSCHIFSLFFPALLLLLLLLPSSPLNSNRFPQVLTSFSPFLRDETDQTPSPPRVSLDGVLSTSVYKSSKLNTAIIKKKKSNLEKIEDDLAKARAAILRAVQLQNFTSEKEEIFVPKGSIYRNAYAFYQLST